METGIESISLPTKEVVPSETQRLEWVFGKEAEINQKENGEWSVDMKLKSRGIVPGGQKINLTLSDETEIKIDYGLGGTPWEKEGVYQLKKILVNEEEMDLPSKVYISPGEPIKDPLDSDFLNEEQKKLYRDKFGPISDFINKVMLGEHLSNEVIPTVERQVIIRGLDSAEDLVGIMHEFGHIRTMPENFDYRSYQKVFDEIIDLNPGVGLSDESVNCLNEALMNENRASGWALQKIKELREQGVDLFPGETSLSRVELFLSLMMSTYLGSGMGDLNIGKHTKEVNKLLTFSEPKN